LTVVEMTDRFDIVVLANGAALPDSRSHSSGIARALVEFNAELRGRSRRRFADAGPARA